MFRIALCDDQQQITEQLKGIIDGILSKYKDQYIIDMYYSGEELISVDVNYDIIFLDIEMPGLDGIQVGSIIKHKYEKCNIVMATISKDRFNDAFRINAFRYVTKPFVLEEIKEAINTTLENSLEAVDDTCIELFYQRVPCDIPFKDIMFIKSYNGYSEFMVGKRIFRKEESLSTIEDKLDTDYFIRVHRQYIVNMRWINKYSDRKIEIDKYVIPVSKRRCKEFEQEFIKFDLKFNRRL